MKKLVVFSLLVSFLLAGCSNLGALASLAATGYGIYRAVSNK